MAEKKIKKNAVGKVTESEKDEIKFLFERKNGLNELFKSLNDPSHSLYDRIVQDMGVTSTKFQKWWDEMSSKYKWKGAKEHHWEINFDTCEIYLVKDK
jgi:CXXX repeat modification system protein